MANHLEICGVQDAEAEASVRADRVDPVLGTFLERFREKSAAAARQLDDRAARGAHRGPLHGMLIGVKDLIAVREAPTTGQSVVHDREWWAGRDATVVERVRAAGAVIVGKTTMTEHGIGHPDPDCGFPVPRNPWDLDRWPGGSSCGSANGLPSGLFTVGLGTDSNGSLRVPAALCGATAIKPTYGLVPVQGIRPLARSIDVVGPLARNVRDCVDVLAVLSERNRVSWPSSLRDVRIGVPHDWLRDAPLSDDCQQAFTHALEDLQRAGAQVVEVSLPGVAPLIAAQFVTVTAEAYEVYREQLRAHWGRFGRPFRWSVILGGLLDAATYLRAQRIRAWAATSLARHFNDVAVIATPTWPSTAPRYDDAAGLRQVSALPDLWSAVGFPAIALPMGLCSDGLPLSLQLAGPPWSDFELAAVADVYQQATGWHLVTPEIPEDAHAGPVVLPQREPQEPTAGFADAVRATGVPVAEEELPILADAWAPVSRLLDTLPDLPAEFGPLAKIELALTQISIDRSGAITTVQLNGQ
jgi:aspartyl-tRNA(Asn)/glutamyl-tRNA(Gln) amidotransferase subunit A